MNLQLLLKKYKWFVIIFIVYVLVDIRLLYSHAVPTGDEPHYLLITHSLVYDHDIDLSNNYQNKDWKRFYDKPDLDPHYALSANSSKYSMHSIGLPLLLCIPYLVGGYLACMIFMSAIMIGILFLSCKVIENIQGHTLSHPSLILLLGLSTPCISFASQIYPELIAGFIMALGLYIFLFNYTPASLTVLCLSLGLLPFLHIKYFVLVFFLTTLIIIRIDLWLYRFILIVWIGLIIILLSLWNHSHFGSYSIIAVYGDYSRFMNKNYVNVWRAFQTYLFDPQFGLLFQSPIYLLAPSGVFLLIKFQRKSLIERCVIPACFLFYLLFICTQPLWLIGWSTAFRFLIPVLPCLLIPTIIVIDIFTNKFLEKLKNILGYIGITFGIIQIVNPASKYYVVRRLSRLLHIPEKYFPHYWDYSPVGQVPSYYSVSTICLTLFFLIAMVFITVFFILTFRKKQEFSD